MDEAEEEERMALLADDADKQSIHQTELLDQPGGLRLRSSPSGHGDQASQAFGHDLVVLSDVDNARIRSKTDLNILPILIWVYFLQVIDKTTLGYAAIFGLQQDTHLTGRQYSLVGSIAPIAQLAWQPFSSFLIVKVPPRILMPTLVLGWGIAQASMGACRNYSGLMVTRFFLGLFEAGCLPLFSMITSHWYRRAEQPLRVAAWYSMNGIANLTAAALSYGLGQIQSDTLFSWQIIFLFCGLMTVITAPFIWWRLSDEVATAKFLTPRERAQGIERLRANQTGTGNTEFKWDHVLEMALEPKTYLFISMTLLLNTGAQVSNTFGPLILAGIGFDKYKSSLLNIPFGILQFLTILVGSWAATKSRYKSAVLAISMLPVLASAAMLYALPRDGSAQAPLMVGFYLFAFLFAGNPLIVSWMIGNTAGTTKKSVLMSCYQGASSAGNIIGPLLFNSKDAPAYRPGLRVVLGIFVALIGIVMIQLANLMFLNKLQSRRRVRNGKAAVIKDRSMEDRYVAFDEAQEREGEPQHLGDEISGDVTDGRNDEFTYIY